MPRAAAEQGLEWKIMTEGPVRQMPRPLIDQFMIHQGMAVLACPALTILIVIVLRLFPAAWQLLMSSELAAGTLIAITFGTGLMLGYVLPRQTERGASLGRWTWAPPCTVFLLLFGIEARKFGWDYTMSEFFNPRDGDEGLALALFTFPMGSALAYSIGATIGFVRQKRQSGSRG